MTSDYITNKISRPLRQTLLTSCSAGQLLNIPEAEGDLFTAVHTAAQAVSTFAELKSPNYKGAVEHLARLRELLGSEKFQEALKNVDIAIPPEVYERRPGQQKEQPQETNWANLGRRYEDERKWSEAIEAYSKALSAYTPEEKEKKGQQYAAINARLGVCLRQAERLEEALELQKENFEIFKRAKDFKGQADSFMEIALLNQLLNN